MKEQTGRSVRVAELIREETAKLLMKGVKDPRVGFVSVMNVEMSPDLRYADVYVSLYGSEKEKKSSLIALQNSAGWMRREIGKHLRMRVTPELRFFPDNTLEKVYHLEEVIQQIHEDRSKAPMLHVGFPEIIEELKQTESFLIVSHVSPDGDAIGSMLGLLHFLRALGKKRVACALADEVPVRYRQLPGASEILSPRDEAPEYDLAILVDVCKLDRIGAIADWITIDHRIMVIDHHLEESPDGAIGITDPSYAAVGEMITELFDASGIEMTRDAAHAAYVAQITDTLGFRFANTNARSHRIAAKLHEHGLDTATICREVFDLITLPKYRLLERTLARTEVLFEGRVAHSWVSEKDLAEVSGKKEDLDGLVNFPRNIEGVQVGILFHGLNENETKMSFRAQPGFNCAEFCKRFGGGGHAGAAAARVDKPLHVLTAEVLEQLKTALGEGA